MLSKSSEQWLSSRSNSKIWIVLLRKASRGSMSKFHKSLIEEGLNLRKNWKGGRHFCVVASPKSASYFTVAVISKYLSVPQVSYNEEKSREISIEKALSLSGRDSVVHLHSLPDNDMYRIITCIGILPIILT